MTGVGKHHKYNNIEWKRRNTQRKEERERSTYRVKAGQKEAHMREKSPWMFSPLTLQLFWRRLAASALGMGSWGRERRSGMVKDGLGKIVEKVFLGKGQHIHTSCAVYMACGRTSTLCTQITHTPSTQPI